LKKKIVIAIVSAIALALFLSGCGSDRSTDTATQIVMVTETIEPLDVYEPSGFTNAEDKFLYDAHGLHNNVLDNTPDEEIISLGHKVCHALDNGRTFDTVLAYVFPEDKYKSGENIEFAYDIIFGAIDNLCPQYNYQLKE